MAANQGFRSAPNLLASTYCDTDDALSRSWSPIPTLQRDSLPRAGHSRLSETLSNGSLKPHDRYGSRTSSPLIAQLPLDDQRSESIIESPIFGPREEGLFRDEIPYDMVSPLSQLEESGWRESPRHILEAASPDLSVPETRDADFHHFSVKQATAERRRSPESRSYRTVPPESSLRHDYEPRHDSHPVDGTYYIVPGGMNVVFQDEEGNEIARVGDFSGRRRKISPVIVQDEYGHELYRTSDIHGSSVHSTPEPGRHRSHRRQPEEAIGYDRHHKPRSKSADLNHDRYSQRSDSEGSHRRSEPPTIILIDRTGHQVPIMPYIHDGGTRYRE